jgi:hypothetical protein
MTSVRGKRAVGSIDDVYCFLSAPGGGPDRGSLMHRVYIQALRNGPMARIIRSTLVSFFTPVTTRGRCRTAFGFALYSSTSFMPDAKRKSTRLLMETRRNRKNFARCAAANDKRKKVSATGKVKRQEAALRSYARHAKIPISLKTSARRSVYGVSVAEGRVGQLRRGPTMCFWRFLVGLRKLVPPYMSLPQQKL